MKFTVVILFLFAGLFSFASFNSPTSRVGMVQLKGVVIQSNSKQVIEGANVEINGTTIGTLTDKDGKFVLWVEEFPDKMTISHKDFAQKKIKLESSKAQNINIGLEKAEITQKKKKKGKQ